jgi:vanillate monooxygenase ferredoxin subunit
MSSWQTACRVDLSCEQGMCGACLTRVLEGRPDHREVVLSATEQEAGDQMTICCSRSSSALLVLDF